MMIMMAMGNNNPGGKSDDHSEYYNINYSEIQCIFVLYGEAQACALKSN